MKKTFNFIMAVTIALTIIGCSTTAHISRSWMKPDLKQKNLSGTLVVAVSENDKLRILFEDDFVKVLKKHGVHAVASYKDGLGPMRKEKIIAYAQKNNLESILVSHYVGSNSTEIYHPDVLFYGAVFSASSNGDVQSNYSYTYEVDSSASYYTENKFLMLVSSLYVTSTREMVWNAVSTAQQGGDPRKLFMPFVNSFVGQATKDGLVQ